MHEGGLDIVNAENPRVRSRLFKSNYLQIEEEATTGSTDFADRQMNTPNLTTVMLVSFFFHARPCQ